MLTQCLKRRSTGLRTRSSSSRSSPPASACSPASTPFSKRKRNSFHTTLFTDTKRLGKTCSLNSEPNHFPRLFYSITNFITYAQIITTEGDVSFLSWICMGSRRVGGLDGNDRRYTAFIPRTLPAENQVGNLGISDRSDTSPKEPGKGGAGGGLFDFQMRCVADGYTAKHGGIRGIE